MGPLPLLLKVGRLFLCLLEPFSSAFELSVVNFKQGNLLIILLSINRFSRLTARTYSSPNEDQRRDRRTITPERHERDYYSTASDKNRRYLYLVIFMHVTSIYRIAFSVGSTSLKRVSPIIQMQHRPSKIMHYEQDDNAETVAGGMHSSGRMSSTKELISPGSKNSQTSDDRNHHTRHKHEDGKLLKIFCSHTKHTNIHFSEEINHQNQ